MSERPHGYARYKLDGCRCYTCGWAVASYRDAREYAIRRGQWQPWTDAEPVRQHVRNLQACGLGTRRIAALAGIDRKRLQGVMVGRPERGTGPQEKVRPALAAAVLAVEPTFDNLGSAIVVDSTGTIRRLRALVAAGWPQQHLAVALGMTPGNFGATIRRDRTIVRTARAVRALYDAYWRADPIEHGATQAGVTRARRHAAANGWAPAGAWDDDAIDDPAAVPDMGGKTTRQGAIVEDTQWLIDTQGYTREQAAERLGTTRATVNAAFSRAQRAAHSVPAA
jgi:transcriptional regulator